MDETLSEVNVNTANAKLSLDVNGIVNHHPSPQSGIGWDDPLSTVLSRFDALPASDREEMLADFAAAVRSHDVKNLLQTFADWAATAEAYATEGMVDDILTARDRFYTEEMGWDIGEFDRTERLQNTSTSSKV